MLSVNLFAGVDPSRAKEVLTEPYLAKKLKRIQQLIKDHRDVYLYMMCRPEDREPCIGLLNKFGVSITDKLHNVDKRTHWNENGVGLSITLKHQDVLNIPHVGKMLAEHVEEHLHLHQEPLDADECEQLEEILAWQESMKNNNVTFDRLVRGAVAEILMCRMFRSMEEEYGSAAFHLLERGLSRKPLTDPTIVKHKQSLEFFTRHSWGIMYAGAKDSPKIEFDGLVRLCNHTSLILDASTSSAYSQSKNIERRHQLVEKSLSGKLQYMNIIFTRHETSVHSNGKGVDVRLPYFGSVYSTAQEMEQEYPHGLATLNK